MTRLRSFGLALVFVVLCGLVRLAVAESLSPLRDHHSLRLALTALVSLSLTVAANAWALRRLPGRAELRIVRGIGDRALPRAITGIVVGGALFALVLTITWAAGGVAIAWRRLAPSTLVGTVLFELAVIALFAAWEEYVFRGWAFSICVEAFGPNAAAVGLGLGFGLAHLANPSPSLMAIASVTFAGAFLAYAMLASRTILFPIGIHTGWNFVQVLSTAPPYVELTRSPKAWLSGGEWGLEGSIAAVCVTAVAAVIASWALTARAAPRP